MRENLTTGSTPFRKAYLRSLIDIVEVDDAQIRIKGSKDVLERAVLASGWGTEPRSQMSTKWPTRHDSNVWPSPSEGDALSS
jgi:site-specific DNA recombinase